MNKDFFIKQLDEILQEYSKIKSRPQSEYVEIEEITTIQTKAKAAVERIVGANSVYFQAIETTLVKNHISDGEKLRTIIGPITALKSDIQNGYLKSMSDIIHSEVFSDYLEMAEHLLNEGYKDPAAVLIGSTLETHLRELCKSNKIDIEIKNSKNKLIPKKADLMNSDLAKANIITVAYQKQIIAWLGIRNSAAHGKYSEYSVEEVKLMLQGIRQFI